MIKIFGDMVDQLPKKRFVKNGEFSIKFLYNGSTKTDSIKLKWCNFHNSAILTKAFVDKFFKKIKIFHLNIDIFIAK